MPAGFSPVRAGTDKEERQFHRLTKIAVNTAPDSYLQLSMPPLTAVCLRPVRLSPVFTQSNQIPLPWLQTVAMGGRLYSL